MDQPTSTTGNCCCNVPATNTTAPVVSGVRKTARTIPSVMMSVLIAFFPKCPMCWAAYMSMFGCVGIAQLPYMSWLFPVLVGFLAIHLFMIYRKAARSGYAPFIVSLAGATAMLLGRLVFPQEKWLLITAMSFIIAGSLLNSFSHNIPSLKLNKQGS